jgi:hypothetical protein
MEWDLEDPLLALIVGDVLEVLDDDGGDWLLGCKGAARGYFPRDFTASLAAQPKNEELPVTQKHVGEAQKKSAEVGKVDRPLARVEAKFDFDPAGMEWDLEDPLLALTVGDVLEVLEDDGGDWLLGCKGAARGYFPRDFTAMMYFPEPDSPANPPGNSKMIALFDYDAGEVKFEDGMEGLPLKAGDIIEVIDDSDADWVHGRLVSKPNVRGMFPRTFAQAIIQFVAEFDFDPAEIDDFPDGLKIKEGDLVEVLEEDDAESDWTFVQLVKDPKKRGLVPKTHLKKPSGPFDKLGDSAVK